MCSIYTYEVTLLVDNRVHNLLNNIDLKTLILSELSCLCREVEYMEWANIVGLFATISNSIIKIMNTGSEPFFVKFLKKGISSELMSVRRPSNPI